MPANCRLPSRPCCWPGCLPFCCWPARVWNQLWQKTVEPERQHSSAAAKSGRVLVIGGAGYIGSALVPKLLDAGYRVRVLDIMMYGREPLDPVRNHPQLELLEGDFRHVDNVVRAMRDVEAVVHLGAIVGDPACKLDESLTIDINLSSTRMIAQLAKSHRVERFVFASTCSVYGARPDVLDERSEARPLGIYGNTKYASEMVLQDLADASFAPTILRFATIYGLSGRTRFDLVVNLLTAKAKIDGQITVHDGDQWRPFVHVEDAASAIMAVLQAPLATVGNEVFNVGSNEQNYTIRQVGELIHQQVVSAELMISESGQDGRDYRVDFSKIRNLLSFQTCLDGRNRHPAGAGGDCERPRDELSRSPVQQRGVSDAGGHLGPGPRPLGPPTAGEPDAAALSRWLRWAVAAVGFVADPQTNRCSIRPLPGRGIYGRGGKRMLDIVLAATAAAGAESRDRSGGGHRALAAGSSGLVLAAACRSPRPPLCSLQIPHDASGHRYRRAIAARCRAVDCLWPTAAVIEPGRAASALEHPAGRHGAGRTAPAGHPLPAALFSDASASPRRAARRHGLGPGQRPQCIGLGRAVPPGRLVCGPLQSGAGLADPLAHRGLCADSARHQALRTMSRWASSGATNVRRPLPQPAVTTRPAPAAQPWQEARMLVVGEYLDSTCRLGLLRPSSCRSPVGALAPSGRRRHSGGAVQVGTPTVRFT